MDEVSRPRQSFRTCSVASAVIALFGAVTACTDDTPHAWTGLDTGVGVRCEGPSPPTSTCGYNESYGNILTETDGGVAPDGSVPSCSDVSTDRGRGSCMHGAACLPFCEHFFNQFQSTDPPVTNPGRLDCELFPFCVDVAGSATLSRSGYCNWSCP